MVGVDNIDLHVSTGELVVLKGNSGSGKSTLLALLAGLDQPTSGELIVAGRDLKEATPEELTQYRRETVGVVFQSFNLLPTLTVLENVSLPALLAAGDFAAVECQSPRTACLAQSHSSPPPPAGAAFGRRDAAHGHCPSPHQ